VDFQKKGGGGAKGGAGGKGENPIEHTGLLLVNEKRSPVIGTRGLEGRELTWVIQKICP